MAQGGVETAGEGGERGPPPGFERFDKDSPLLRPWRPIYQRQEADRVILGVWLREEHTNSRGRAHGGLLAALADQAMGLSCVSGMRATGALLTGLWTTSMTVDYLGAARPGQWLAFDTYFTKGGKVSCHAEADITADGETVARARADFRVQLSDEGRRRPAA